MIYIIGLLIYLYSPQPALIRAQNAIIHLQNSLELSSYNTFIDIDTTLIYGQILIELKQYTKAKNILCNALQICPTNTILLVSLAVLTNIINQYKYKYKYKKILNYNKLKKNEINLDIEFLNFEFYKFKICGYNDIKELASSEV